MGSIRIRPGEHVAPAHLRLQLSDLSLQRVDRVVLGVQRTLHGGDLRHQAHISRLQLCIHFVREQRRRGEGGDVALGHRVHGCAAGHGGVHSGGGVAGQHAHRVGGARNTCDTVG